MEIAQYEGFKDDESEVAKLPNKVCGHPGNLRPGRPDGSNSVHFLAIFCAVAIFSFLHHGSFQALSSPAAGTPANPAGAGRGPVCSALEVIQP